jgi:membrane protease YdiL (CAAX protease family)
MINYLRGTRHPWMSLLFVLPLLLAYEGGRWSAGPAAAEEVRNGAEHWMRQGVESLGIPADHACPGLLLGVLFVWSFCRRHDRPKELLSLGIGMIIECGLFAGGLYLLSQAILPVFDKLGVFLHASADVSASGLDPRMEKVLCYLGAGIYEEAMFRLGLFTVLCWLFHCADFSSAVSMNLAAIASALIFSGAHHMEATAEPFHAAVFLYRTIAGFYFAWIYQLRGLGVAVGAHAGYNLLIGLLIPSTG